MQFSRNHHYETAGLVSPNVNTERNVPHHERANGNGKALIKNKLNKYKLQSKEPMKRDYQPKTHWVIYRC